MKAHESEHFDATDFCCDVVDCDKKFKSAWKLARHQTYTHTIPKFKCNYCDKTYHHQKKMREHENVHKNIRNYKCLHCEKAYSTSSYLR